MTYVYINVKVSDIHYNNVKSMFMTCTKRKSRLVSSDCYLLDGHIIKISFFSIKITSHNKNINGIQWSFLRNISYNCLFVF